MKYLLLKIQLTMNIENSDTINTEGSNMVDSSETDEPDTTQINNTESNSEKPKNFHQIL